MKILIRIGLLLLLLPMASESEANNCKHDKTTFRCVKYLRNYDGDTITVQIDGVHDIIGRNISVRINGVDTPELRTSNKCEKRAARNAKNLVRSLLKTAKHIELRNIKRDKYFRLLSDIYVDGKRLSSIIFKNGLGYKYSGGTKSKINWCKSAKHRIPANLRGDLDK